MTAFVWGTSGVYGASAFDSVYTLIGAIREIELQTTHEFTSGAPVWTHATTITVPYAQETQAAIDRVIGNIPYASRSRYRDAFGNVSAWSLVGYHNTLRDTMAPAVPSGVAAASTGLGLQITWNANTEADFAYYQVRTSPSVSGAPSVWTQYDVRVNSFTLPAVTGPYWVQVQAVDTSGNKSGWS